MARVKSTKSILILVAVICFAIGVLDTLGVDLTDKINWTDLGLFFGFLAFLF
jgi:preprotein translocase subunit SecE